MLATYSTNKIIVLKRYVSKRIKKEINIQLQIGSDRVWPMKKNKPIEFDADADENNDADGDDDDVVIFFLLLLLLWLFNLQFLL